MQKNIQKIGLTVGALGALALGGSALADAASTGSNTTTNQAPSAQAPHDQRPHGRHVGANGQREQALSGATAAKVKAAALDKVSGGTVERVETDVDSGSPYEAHVRKPDGTEVTVLVNGQFQVTAVEAHAGPPGGRHG